MEIIDLTKVKSEYLLQELILRIDSDPDREGLEGTPKRIVSSWKEIYKGYRIEPKNIFKTFDVPDGYDQMILLRDIEFYSVCEHHMLPFFGKAHIAYIPKGRVVGISKLARLLEAFSRRLQIQERIGQQITSALMTHLDPKGAACILNAQHLCMTMRGVGKQHSQMLTASLTGVFKLDPSARSELYKLIGEV